MTPEQREHRRAVRREWKKNWSPERRAASVEYHRAYQLAHKPAPSPEREQRRQELEQRRLEREHKRLQWWWRHLTRRLALAYGIKKKRVDARRNRVRVRSHEHIAKQAVRASARYHRLRLTNPEKLQAKQRAQTIRRATDPVLKAKRKASSHAAYHADLEASRAKGRARYHAAREQRRKVQRVWRMLNREKILAQEAKYRATPEQRQRARAYARIYVREKRAQVNAASKARLAQLRREAALWRAYRAELEADRHAP